MVNQNKKDYEGKYGQLFNPNQFLPLAKQDKKEQKDDDQTITVIHKHIHTRKQIAKQNAKEEQSKANIAQKQSDISSNTKDIIGLLMKLKSEARQRRRVLSAISKAAEVNGDHSHPGLADIQRQLETKVRQSLTQQQQVKPTIQARQTELDELKGILLTHKNMIHALSQKIDRNQQISNQQQQKQVFEQKDATAEKQAAQKREEAKQAVEDRQNVESQQVVVEAIKTEEASQVQNAVDRKLVKYRIEMNQYRVLFKEYRKLYQQGIRQLKDLRNQYIGSIKAMKAAQKQVGKPVTKTVVESQAIVTEGNKFCKIDDIRAKNAALKSAALKKQVAEKAMKEAQAAQAETKRLMDLAKEAARKVKEASLNKEVSEVKKQKATAQAILDNPKASKDDKAKAKKALEAAIKRETALAAKKAIESKKTAAKLAQKRKESSQEAENKKVEASKKHDEAEAAQKKVMQAKTDSERTKAQAVADKKKTEAAKAEADAKKAVAKKVENEKKAAVAAKKAVVAKKVAEAKKATVSEAEYAKIWKDAGCTTKANYSDWAKKQTKEALIKDSKVWATSKKDKHKKVCYGALVSESEYAKIWKDAGCTTKANYSDWAKKQTKEQLIKDSKIWATSKKEKHRKGCYGAKKSWTSVKDGERLRLKTWRGTYVSMRNGGKNVVQKKRRGSWEIFIVKILPWCKHETGPCVALYSQKWKRYLRARNNKKTIEQSGRKGHYNHFPKGWQWPKFIVQELGDGKFCLRSIFNTYVRANQNGWMDQSGVTKEKTLPKGWKWEVFTADWLADTYEQAKAKWEKKQEEKRKIKPTKPGCYMKTDDTCPKQKNFNRKGYFKDGWGERHKDAGLSQKACEARAPAYNNWCGGKKDHKALFIPGNVFYLYSHSNFRGRRWGGKAGNYKSVGRMNDKATSIKIAPGYHAIVYEHGSFSGLSKVISSHVKNLNTIGFNDKISSVKIIKGAAPPVVANPVTVYEHGNYQGKAVNYKEGLHKNIGDFNDKASSIKVTKGYYAVLWEHGDGHGKKLVITKDEPDLNKLGFNDTVSSLKVVKGSYCNEKYSGKGEDYRGCQNKTIKGNTCQKWSLQTPNKHINTPEKKAQFGVGDHNYCRNPDNAKQPWCYTTNKNEKWGYCKPKVQESYANLAPIEAFENTELGNLQKVAAEAQKKAFAAQAATKAKFEAASLAKEVALKAARTSELAKAKCAGKPIPQSVTKVETESADAKSKLDKQLKLISKLQAESKENARIVKQCKTKRKELLDKYKREEGARKEKTKLSKEREAKRKAAEDKKKAEEAKAKVKKGEITEEQRKKLEAEKKASEERAKVQAAEKLSAKTKEDELIAKKKAAEEAKRKKAEEEARKKKDAELKAKKEAEKKAKEELNKQLESKRKAREARRAEAARKRAERQQKAAEAARKKEIEAKKRAEAEAKKKAEEAAAKKAEEAEAKKKAEEAAKQARAAEEAERKRKEELRKAKEAVAKAKNAADKKRLEEVSRKAAEAAKKAEEERARKAKEEEAKRKAAELAARKKRQAEEARKRALEAAKRRAAAAERARKRAEAAKRKAADAEKKRKAAAAAAEEKAQALREKVKGYFKTGSIISLQSGGKYGYLRPYSSSRSTLDRISADSRWRVISLGGNWFALWSETYERYLRVQPNGTTDFQYHHGPWYHIPGGWQWERFTYNMQHDGRVVIKSKHGHTLYVNVKAKKDQRVKSDKKVVKGYSSLFRVTKLGEISPTTKTPSRHGSARTSPKVRSGLVGRYIAEDFYHGGAKWDGEYLGGKLGNNFKVRGQPSIKWRNINGKWVKVVRFNKDDGVIFDSRVNSGTYTVVVVGRNLRDNGRVVDGVGKNVLVGWWGNRTGVFYQDGWLTHKTRGGNKAFHVMACTNNGKAYMDSFDCTKDFQNTKTNGSTPKQWSINYGASVKGEWSISEIGEIMFYNRHLSDAELVSVSDALRAKYKIPKFYDCGATSTPFSDEGKGNMVYLDRHNLNCKKHGSIGLLNKIQLSRDNKGKMRLVGNCCADPNNAEMITQYTKMQDDGKGNMVYLDKHQIDCKGGLMASLKLVRGGAAKKIALQYDCKACGASKCTNHSTPWNSDGKGNTIYLDRHNIQCPAGKAIRSLRLHRDGKGQNIQWRYQCCVPGTGRYLPMPQKKVLIGGTHHMKHQRKIPGSQIPWSNPNHFTISYWIKTNPATGHWRSIFRWGNDGSRRSPAAWLYCCRHSYKYHFRVRTERCCGTNVWAHGGNDGVDAHNLHHKGFRYHKWNHMLTTVNGRHVKHYVNGQYLTQGWMPDHPQQLKNETMYVPDWTGDHQGTYVRNMWWHDGTVVDRQVREIYKKSKFTGWDAPREIPHKVLINGTHHLYHQKKIPGNQIPLSNQEQYTMMYWVKTNPPSGHWRNIFRWGNKGHDRAPAAWFWCCGNQYKYHFRIRTQRCCGKNIWAHGGNDGVDGHGLEKRGFRYDKWNHMCTVVNRKRVTHYINGQYHSAGNLPHYPQALKNHTMYIPDSGHKNAENIYTYVHKMIWFDGSLNRNEVSKWYNNTKPKGWNHIHWRQRLSTNINHVFRNGNYVALWSVHKKYVGMHGGHVRQLNINVKNENVFQVRRLPGNQIALYNIVRKRYLRAHASRGVDQSGHRGHYTHLPTGWSWERFEVEDCGGGRVALFTYHRRYITAHSNTWMWQTGQRHRNSRKPKAWNWELLRPIEVKKQGNRWLYHNPEEPKRRETEATGPAVGHFKADDYRNNRRWKNHAGIYPDATEFYGEPRVVWAHNDGKKFRVIRFGRSDGVRFDTKLAGWGNGRRGPFTLAVVARNLRGNGRLIDGTTNNCLHGWWGGRVGVVHHGHWATHDNMGWQKNTQSYNFHCVMANSDGLVYVDGEFRSKWQRKSYAPKQWTVNCGQYAKGEWTTSEVAEMIFWNNAMTHKDMQKECRRLTQKYKIRYWARYAWVHTPGDYLHMRKVKVFGSDGTKRERLVSENKPCTGSRNGWGGNHNRVVQRNWPGDYANHTHKSGWWQVDLKKEFCIDRVEIWNRRHDGEHGHWQTVGSCCRGRFGNAYIRLKDQRGRILWERRAGPDYWHAWCPGREVRLAWDIMGMFQDGRKLRIKSCWGNYVRMHTSHGHHGRWRRNHGHDGGRINARYHLVDRGGAGHWEIFQVKRLPQYGYNCIALYGVHGRFLRARGDKKTIDQSGHRGHWTKFPNGWVWERFFVHHVRGQYFGLKTVWGTWLSAHRNGHMVQSPTRHMIDLKQWRWERFSAQWLHSNHVHHRETGRNAFRGKRPVILYEHPNYKGRSQGWTIGHHRSVHWMNDKESSIRVMPGYHCWIYEHGNYRGRKARISGNTNYHQLKKLGFNDKISSLRVYRNDGLS